MTGRLKVTTVLLTAIIALVGGSLRASADLYSDPSGFSITYPEGWFPLSKADHGQIHREMPPQLKKALDDKQFDLNRIAVMIMRGADEFEEYVEGLNVVVENSQIPVSESRASELRNEIEKQFRSVGAQITMLGATVRTYASRDVYVIDYGVTLPGVDMPLRQRQYMLPGGGKTYIVTCSSTEAAFPKYEATFEQMMNSFQAPAPKRFGFDLTRAGSMGAVGGIIGGLVALLGGLLKVLFGGSKKSEG